MKSLSKTITNYLIKKEIQDEKLKDETIYGLEMIISRVIFYMAIILISIICKINIVITLVFVMTFKTMRRFNGGFHFNNKVLCFVSSTLLFQNILLFSKYINLNDWCELIANIISVCIVILLAPCNDTNINLSKHEYMLCKKFSRMSSIIILCLYTIIKYIFLFESIGQCISLSMYLNVILLILGKIKEKR